MTTFIGARLEGGEQEKLVLTATKEQMQLLFELALSGVVTELCCTGDSCYEKLRDELRAMQAEWFGPDGF